MNNYGDNIGIFLDTRGKINIDKKLFTSLANQGFIRNRIFSCLSRKPVIQGKKPLCLKPLLSEDINNYGDNIGMFLDTPGKIKIDKKLFTSLANQGFIQNRIFSCFTRKPVIHREKPFMFKTVIV
jgi:hypothetical protein